MRYALLSDVHGNAHALLAVLAAAKARGVDGYVCAGDLVGYGALPNECVDLLAEHSALCIAGNHELMVDGRLTDERCTAMARAGVRWTRGVLRDDVAAFLAGLPLRLDLPGLTVAHGSLEDPQEYVRAPARAAAQLAMLPPAPHCLVLGHTHHPWVFGDQSGNALVGRTGSFQARAGERFLVNPGSVGQSRSSSPHARYAVLDLVTGRVELLRERYDTSAARAALVHAGLPPDSYHCRPRWLGGLRQQAVELLSPRWSPGAAR